MEALKLTAAILQAACKLNKPLRESDEFLIEGELKKVSALLDDVDAIIFKATEVQP